MIEQILTFYTYGLVFMGILESIQRGYENKDIDLQLLLNITLWPLVILSGIGHLIRKIQ